jgi:nitrous-oxide reductase
MRRLSSLFILILALGLVGCGGSSSGSNDGASASYVPPGEKDDYSLFYSGGHSGQVFVAGLPSLREIQTVPVFTPSPGHGYGFSKESKEVMGEYRWGDVHHPALSKTDGTYDGRWLFVNDHAPHRLRAQLEQKRPREGSWVCLHGGPDVWHMRVQRRGASPTQEPRPR